MKKSLITLIIASLSTAIAYSQNTFEITADGFSFSPSTITISSGDIIQFNTGSFHPVLQVSQATWNANGSAALAGGFDFPDGTGSITFEQTGTYYYVCPNHISSGMKGNIIVSGISGSEINKSEYPNLIVYLDPLADVLNLSFFADRQGVFSIRIMDISGRILIESEKIPYISGNNNMQFETGPLVSGVFLLRFNSEERYQTITFTK